MKEGRSPSFLLRGVGSGKNGRELGLRDSSEPARYVRAWARQGIDSRLETALAAVPFAVIDTETLGWGSAKPPALLSLAAVRVHAGQAATPVFHTHINAGQPVPPEIARLTGIDDDARRAAPPLGAALAAFARYTGGAVLVAHHAAFDARVLQAPLWSCFRAPLRRPILDTAMQLGVLRPAWRDFRLEAIVEALGLPQAPRHTAAGDAWMTAHLWIWCLVECQARQVTTLGQLLGWLARAHTLD